MTNSPTDQSPIHDHDTLPPSLDPAVPDHIQEPPTTWKGNLKQIGPGLIIAASIVGSGELIATTKTGAQAGISLLWLIIIGCVIKVFVQIELGRYTMSQGETTLSALDEVPGPRWKVNWIVWFWVFMTAAGIGQLGGIVGGVGQALALTFPLQGDYEDAIALPSEKEVKRYVHWDQQLTSKKEEFTKLSEEQQQRIQRGQEVMKSRLTELGERGTILLQTVKDDPDAKIEDPWTWDDKIWAILVSVFTAWLLYRGNYSLLQTISLWLVGTFTFITIGNVIALQMTSEFHIPFAEFLRGLSFGLPDAIGNQKPMATALATFGIIGVGAAELVSYPYWCIEKGYAKFTGPREETETWSHRAKGWLQVMKLDAFASMILFTVATLLFFVMGVAVLYREGRDPDGMRMVATLAQAYVPVFGVYARWLFLIGAIAVLYSTFMAANAANTRMYTDAMKMFRLIPRNEQASHDRWIKIFSVLLPLTCMAIYCSGANPVTLILFSGIMQAAMLPMLGLAALYFRYVKTDRRLLSGPIWDTFLIISVIGLAIAGGWGVFTKVNGLF